MTTGVASFLVTLTLLAGVAFLHHRTSSPASESSAGGRVQRSAWSDGLDVHHRDADLPQRMRGVSDERAHYMDTITPADDDDTAWFSACITVPPPRHDDKIILTEGGVATPAASLTPAQRAVAAREQATARALRQKREAIARQGRPLPGSPFQRDADGKTKRVHPQQPPANDDTNPWLDPTNPFSFKRKPKRNPSEACIYSPEYRAEHPDLCSKVNKTPGVNTGTLQGPFRGVAFDIVPGKDMACAAWGWFSNDLNSTGWNYLYIESNPTLDDEAQARAAGWLEGALTIQPIWEHRTNEFQNLFTNGIIASTTKAFLNDMTLYNLEMVATNGQTDPYWTQMGLIYQQLQGIWEGYTYQQTDPTAAITYFQILCLQYDGDMSDIQIAAGVNTPPSVTDPLQKIMDYLIRTGHCSALIKLLDGNADLFAAHDTWAGFSSMHRMFKAYVLPFSQVASTRVQFSSYPAFLASTDDWYQTYETQLTVLETTNDIVNLNNSTNSLYNLVTSSSVGAWARAIVATRLATGGQEWTTFFSVANSGTYNNRQSHMQARSFALSSSFADVPLSLPRCSQNGWSSTMRSSLRARLLSRPTHCGSSRRCPGRSTTRMSPRFWSRSVTGRPTIDRSSRRSMPRWDTRHSIRHTAKTIRRIRRWARICSATRVTSVRSSSIASRRTSRRCTTCSA